MNKFASIIRLDDFSYEKVKYFSVEFDGNEVNEFYDFLNRMEDDVGVENDLSNLLVWIEEIGDNYGATQDKFRNEAIIASVSALPPPKKQMLSHEIIVDGLRLYCFVANEHVVFLFNGGMKTEGVNNAKDCPNVGHYIRQANQLTKKIEELFKVKEIKWNSDQTDIIFDTSIQIEI